MKLDLPVTLSSLASCVHGDTVWGGHGLVLPSSEKRREKKEKDKKHQSRHERGKEIRKELLKIIGRKK